MSDTKRVRLTNDSKMNERCINTIRVLVRSVRAKSLHTTWLLWIFCCSVLLIHITV